MAPRIIERADFFTWFFDLLKELLELPEVKDWRVTAKAFVLVILNYDGIKIYFLFVRLALEEIPDNFDLRDDILQKKIWTRSVCVH
jgi:poly(A) polymerase